MANPHRNRRSAKTVAASMALAAEVAAYNTHTEFDFHMLVERLNTLNHMAKQLGWTLVNARIQRTIDDLLAKRLNSFNQGEVNESSNGF